MNRRDVRIPEPCAEPWENMVGDDRERHCARCDKSVHHLSGMTEAEARGLLAAPREGEPLCVRYRATRTGRIRFIDTRLGQRLRGLVAGTAVAAGLAGLGLQATGCDDIQDKLRDVVREIFEPGDEVLAGAIQDHSPVVAPPSAPPATSTVEEGTPSTPEDDERVERQIDQSSHP